MCDRPVLYQNIEVTPKMVRAGLDVLWNTPGFMGQSEIIAESAVKQIFLAVYRAYRESLDSRLESVASSLD